MSQCMNSSEENVVDKRNEFSFCPLCQAPLMFLKISPSAHVACCSVVWDGLQDCPDGKECLSTSIFHYRDYAHFELAAYRSSNDYVGPSIENFLCPAKKRSPTKSIKKSYSIKSKSKPGENDILKEENRDLLENENLTGRGNKLTDDRLDNSFGSGASDDEFHVFQNNTKLSKRLLSSPCDKNTKTVAKKLKAVKNNFESTSKNVKTKDCCSVLENNETSFSIKTPIAMNKDCKINVDNNYSEEKHKFKNSGSFCSRIFSNINTSSSDIKLDNKSQNSSKIDNLDISQYLNKETDIDSVENNLNSSLSCDSEEIDFGHKASFTSSPKKTNTVFATSSSSVSYSPLESDESNQLCSEMNAINSTKNVGNVDSLRNENGEKNCGTSVKKVGVFVPKIERKCKLTIGDSYRGELSIQNSINVSRSTDLLISSSTTDYEMSHESGVTEESPSVENDLTEVKDGSSSNNCFKNETNFSDKSSGFSAKETVVRADTGFKSGKKLWSEFFQSVNKKKSEKSKDKVVEGSSEKTRRGFASMNFGHYEELKVNIMPKDFRVNKVTNQNKPVVRRRNTVVKQCPFFKIIPDTSFAVDAFNFGRIPGINFYFLSHYHSDHYIGLSKKFDMPIFCSEITANLVKMFLGVDGKYLNIINAGERRVINGTEVIAFEANHCPGSLMFLFQLRTGQNYLHVGDFRFCHEMETYPELKKLHIHKLYLDTTYCKPEYDFPTQEEVIESVVQIVKDELEKNPRSLIICGTYVIGKEKVFSAVAETFDYSIWTEPHKKRVFKCVNNPVILKRLANNPSDAKVHVLSLNNITFDKLGKHLEKYNIHSNVVAFRPTGWTAKVSGSSYIQKRVQDNIAIFDVPYSEHSSFSELRRFVKFMKPDEIIPTVGFSKSARDEMLGYFKSWLLEEKYVKQPLMDFLKSRNLFSESPH